MKILTYNPITEIKRFLICYRMNFHKEHKSYNLMRQLSIKALFPFYSDRNELAVDLLALFLIEAWFLYRLIVHHGSSFPPYNDKIVLSTLKVKSK